MQKLPVLHLVGGRPVCRLGLASRGDTHMRGQDVLFAVDQGVNFLNWCGTPNGMSKAIAHLGPRRRDVFVCAQFEARSAVAAERELRSMLDRLGTSWIDALTFYYVEEAEEWRQICAPGGSLEYCTAARQEGKVRMLGVTSHQRPLAAAMARSGLLDLLMIRYNAAHRGAETEIFPSTDAVGMPVVAYTCLRWGALLQPTPDDPPGFKVPGPVAWYRFALQSPSVSVALMAPDNRQQFEEDLAVLSAKEPLSPVEFERLAEHGRRVRRHAGRFP